VARVTLICAIALAVIGFVLGDPPEAVAIAFGAGFVLGPFLLLVCWGLTYFLMPKRAGRLFHQHRALQKEVSYGWSDAGLSFQSANGSGQIQWTDLHRWAEGKHTFLFYLTDNLFHFVPRHRLSEAEAADLRTTAATHGPRGR